MLAHESCKSALNNAWDDVLARDIDVICKNSLAIKLPNQNEIILPFLDRDYIIDFNLKKINTVSKQKVDDVITILILHYLGKSKIVPLSDEWVSFRQLKYGNLFFNIFKKLCIDPLSKCFRGNLETFFLATKKFDATNVRFGDAAVIIPALPKIPILCVIWLGDDEVQPSSAILFDSTADSHLYIEDLAMIGDITVRSMIQEIEFFSDLEEKGMKSMD